MTLTFMVEVRSGFLFKAAIRAFPPVKPKMGE